MEEQVIYLFQGEGPEVGKSFIGKRFAEERGLKHGTTSDVIIEAFAKELHYRFSDIIEMAKWEDVAASIKRNKGSWRPWLVWYGNRMCEDDPACLAGALIESGCSVVDGIRRQKELDLIRERYKTEVYWIVRPGYPKKPDNTDIQQPHDATVINNIF